MQQAAIQHHTTRDEELARLIVERAYARERTRRRQSLPRWVRLSLRALPRVVGIVTVSNGLVGLLAVLAPLLLRALGDSWTGWIYTAYSFICPQRPTHTWSLAGEPMAMEQRMVAMYLAFGIAGLLYMFWNRVRRPLPTWAMLLGVVPVLIDVALSTAGIRPSTPVSRLWTGALCSLAVVWWAYPRFDAAVREVRAKMSATPVKGDDPAAPATIWELAGWPGISEE